MNRKPNFDPGYLTLDIEKVCENNWVRRIARVKRAEKRRIKELREEVGEKASPRRKLVRSRLKWAGHVERMEGVDEEGGCHQKRGQKEKRKTETEMGGLREERFGGSGRGDENESEGWRGDENESEGWRGAENESEGWRGAEDESEGWMGAENESEGWRGDENESEGWRGAEDESERWMGAENKSEGWRGDENESEGWRGAENESMLKADTSCLGRRDGPNEQFGKLGRRDNRACRKEGTEQRPGQADMMDGFPPGAA